MSRLRTWGNRDWNEGPVVKRLRAHGADVRLINGRGIPDLLIGWRGVTHLAEVKQPKAKLKDSQAEFARTWKGSPVVTLRTPDEATDWLLGLNAPPVVERVMDRAAVAAMFVDEME